MTVKETVNEGIEKSTNEIKKSAKDWCDYIQDHPAQSMIFGAVIFFAIKGFFNSVMPYSNEKSR